MYKSLIVLLFSSVILLFCQNVSAGNNNVQESKKNQNLQGQVQLKEANDKKYEFFLVKYDRLDVMNSPSSSAAVLGTLAKGDTIKSIGFTESSDDFHFVTKLVKFQYKDQIAYVNSLYL